MPCNSQSRLKLTSPLKAAAGLCLCAIFSTSSAGQQQPHQHGHATLQMGIENNRIDLILISPAQNLLGFEHQPRTRQQEQTLQKARLWLTTQTLVTPNIGHCTLKSASVDFSVKATDQDHHNHNHDDDHEADSETNSEHANIEVSQILNCAGVDLSRGFITPLINQFPEIQALRVEWVTNNGQGSVELNTPNNQFQL